MEQKRPAFDNYGVSRPRLSRVNVLTLEVVVVVKVCPPVSRG